MRKRICITPERLDELEMLDYSETEIASELGCSRLGLFRYRQRIGHPQQIRQGKGSSKYTPEEKKKLNILNQKNYRDRLIAKFGRSTNGRDKREQKEIVLKVLSRPLKRGECLHHLDGNPANNKHNNLVICTNKYHRAVFHTREAELKMSITHQ